MIPRPLTRLAVIIAAASSLLVSGAGAAELVTNGGFESSNPNQMPSGFPPAWTDVDNSVGGPFSGVDNTSGLQHSGDQYAFLGARGVIGTLSQTLNTVIGQAYTLSFFVANDGDGSGVESLTVMFGSLANTVTVTPNNGTFGPYTQFTFSGLIASSAGTVLQFQYRHDDSFYRLDDVSVQGPAGVPEGGSLLLAALPVLLGLCLVHSRQNRALAAG